MSSAVISTPAAQGRPFVFDEEDVAGICPQPSGAEPFTEGHPPQRVVSASCAGVFKDARLAGVTSASRLAVRHRPQPDSQKP